MLLVLVAGLAGCGGNGEAEGGKGRKLTVFAAASLTEAFHDLKQTFEKKTGADVTISFAGTQILRTQIEQGAPADVFASANTSHMKALKKEGHVERFRTFAYNSLVIIVPRNNPADLHSLKDLSDKNVRLVIGTDNVPVGIYARKMLAKAERRYGQRFKSKVLKNAVSMETDVKQVASKVSLGEADAGIVYSSDVTQAVEKKVKVIRIPGELNVTATDTIAALNKAKHPKLAKQWVDFVMSAQGQKILKQHHFTPYASAEQ
jgi:molybdate transport system substrate-binding protein